MSLDLVCDWSRVISRVEALVIFHIDLRADDDSLQQAKKWLHTNELQRFEQFQIFEPKREFALCRSALRNLLCYLHNIDNCQLSIVTDEHGKPYALVNGNPITTHFSVSHSGNHGLIGVAEGFRVGIDVEIDSENRDYLGIAKKVFGSNEFAEMQSLDQEEHKDYFLRIWTFKESIVKAIGTGLKTNPGEFEIPMDLRHGSQKGMIEFPKDSGIQWILEDLSTTQYAAAMAYEVT